MKFVYLALAWLFGVFFLLVGVLSLFQSLAVGICLVSASLFLLPPVRKFVYSKTNKPISVKARTVTIFALVVASLVFIGQSQQQKEQEIAEQKAQEQAELQAKIKQENIDHFNSNREEILSSAYAQMSEKNYEEARSSISKYLVSGDQELLKIDAEAKQALSAIRKAEKTQEILAKLKTVPVTEFEENRNLYQQLVNLHSDNEQYKNKLVHYQTKIKEAEEAKIAAEERKKRIERQFSAWDGSHNNLERVIKKAMNDPDSYEHDETVYWDMGDHLVVRTTYRGKNAFGGVVRNFVKAKVSLDGQILQILDQS